MNTDAYFEIGSSHSVCEDYAIDGIEEKDEEKIAFAIVSDGCSGSNTKGPVDFGARILAHAARGYFCNSRHSEVSHFWKLLEGPKYEENRKLLNNIHAESIAAEACAVVGNFGLSLETMDATIVAAISEGQQIRTFMWGDGAIITRSRSGKIELHHIEYESGAPFYLSYLVKQSRREKYEEEFRNKKKIYTSICLEGETIHRQQREVPAMEGFYLDFDAKEDDIEYIAVVSDGIGTYLNEDDSLRDLMEIAQEFVSFKTPRGAFVNRRLLNGMQKKCRREDIHHYDDISCAAIHFEKADVQ